MSTDSIVIINKAPEISQLEIEPVFANLTPKEKLYAHYCAR
jgi:hypothetical protein